MKTAVLILLGCIAVVNLMQTAVEVPWRELGAGASRIWSGNGIDDVSLADKQCQLIRQALVDNGSPGIVGYITDIKPGPDFVPQWYLAQYALLPAVVEPTSAEQAFVVGYFQSVSNIEHIPDLEPIVKGDGGYVLFRRRRKGQ